MQRAERMATVSVSPSLLLPTRVPQSETPSPNQSVYHRASEFFFMLVVEAADNLTGRFRLDTNGIIDSDIDDNQHANAFYFEYRYTLAHTAITTFVIAILIIFTMFGNSLVLLSILIDRRLQTVPNYLIFSLAVSDLLVAIVVMPIALINEISKHWFLGATLCDVWICSDVLCCTSSILHLVAIALDRYWSVTNINYAHARSKRRVLGMIALIWLISAGISIPPLVGWREPGNDPNKTGVCRISQDPGYTIYSTLGAFYVPLVVMIVMYVRIYIAARKRIRNAGLRRRKAVVNSQIMLVLTEPSITIGTGAHIAAAPRDVNLFTERTANNSSTDSFGEATMQPQAAITSRLSRSANSSCNSVAGGDESAGSGGHKSDPVASNFFESSEPVRCDSVSTPACSTPMRVPRRRSVQWDSHSYKASHGVATAAAAAVAARRRKISELSGGSGNTSGSDAHEALQPRAFRVLHVNFRRKSRGSLSSTHSLASNHSNFPVDHGENARSLDKMRNEQKRQSRAIRTVLLITCVFVLCWTAFFCHALISPLCRSCHFPAVLVSVFVWLGYSNSFCNFVIYSIFSPEFRRAFRNLFCPPPNSQENHVRRTPL